MQQVNGIKFRTVNKEWDVYFDMTEGIKKAFDQNNIAIPYPQMDIHVKQ